LLRCSEDKDSSEHYQHNNPDTKRQQLAGDTLEVSRALVVLHCHGRSPFTPLSAQRPLRAMPTQQVQIDMAIAIVRARRRATPIWAGNSCLTPVHDIKISDRAFNHQTHETSDV